MYSELLNGRNAVETRAMNDFTFDPEFRVDGAKVALGNFSIPTLSFLPFSLSLSLSLSLTLSTEELFRRRKGGINSVLTGKHSQRRCELCLGTRKSTAAGTLRVELHENFSLLKAV